MHLNSTEWSYGDSQIHQKLFRQEGKAEAALEDVSSQVSTIGDSSCACKKETSWFDRIRLEMQWSKMQATAIVKPSMQTSFLKPLEP